MDAMLSFYQALGFDVGGEFAPLAYSVSTGDMKINLHTPELWQSDFDLRGRGAQPGSMDICMVWDGTDAELVEFLGDVEVIEGPIERAGGKDRGATAGISRYIRDPEDNLLEFIIYPA